MSLPDFILKSKRAGYASGAESRKRKYDDGSAGFEIISEGYRYLDRYYGFNPFIGSEEVWDSANELIWRMNYFGEILNKDSDPKKIYSLLREAMLQISLQYPFRGPESYIKQSLRYENQQYGTLDHFHGFEAIFEHGKKVYALYYHGGSIKREKNYRGENG